MAVSLVTGGAGFIGSHVARYRLNAGDVVVVLDDLSGGVLANVPGGARFIEASVTDTAALSAVFREWHFDYVFHLAAYAAEGLSHFIRRFNYMNNVVGSMNVINECVNHMVRCLVFTSSIAVYGASPAPVTEDSPLLPADPYGISKLAVERDLVAAKRMFGLDSVVFRPHNVYGEGQNIADPYRNVIGIFMNRVMKGLPMTIFGDGEQLRAFSHVDDVAPTIAASVERPDAFNRIFNIGADTPHTVNRLARVVAHSFGVTPSVQYLAPRDEVTQAYATHDLLKTVFGVEPVVTLEEGVSRMAAWARSIGPALQSRFGALEITRGLPPSWAEISAPILREDG
ncbi:MAG: NAD-dependent epimerase/dehydratase family protein [Actinomycetota bacterium]